VTILSQLFSIVTPWSCAVFITSKGNPVVTTAQLGDVLKRFVCTHKNVVADTSMITLSNKYLILFHDLYIDGKEIVKMTRDRIKMLMLTLPFKLGSSSLLRYCNTCMN
jgi:hypothetical protein